MMARQMARQMIQQRKRTPNTCEHTQHTQHTKNEAHPVDLNSLDDLERKLFDALTPYFARLASQPAARYDAATFVDTVAATFDQCVAAQVERDINEYWDNLSAVGVPKSDYTTLVTQTIQAVYAEYLPELATTIGQNRKPAQFGQARAFAIATTELTAMRALIMIVLMGTYNDLIETAAQNVG